MFVLFYLVSSFMIFFSAFSVGTRFGIFYGYGLMVVLEVCLAVLFTWLAPKLES
jgi:hypothetical protein